MAAQGSVRLIKYRGGIVAIAGPRRVFLTEEIEQLPRGNRRRRIVALMCLYSRDVDTGVMPGPYCDEDAELFAQLVLEAGSA